MEIRIIDENMRDKWDEYIYSNPYSIAWQCYGWSEVLERHYKFQFFPIAAFDGSNICGILPLYRIKTLFSKDVLISVPHAVAGGIVADSGAVNALLLNKAVQLSKQFESCKIVLKQYKQKIDGPLRTDDNFYNSELNLTENIDKIWAKLDDANKEQITTAEKLNLRLEYPSQDIDIFFKLLLSNHHKSGIPCVSKKWIKSLVTSKMYSMALLKKNNDVVAATMIKEFKQTVSFPFSCFKDNNGSGMSYAYDLYWKLIRLYSSKGFRIFHSGRIPKTNLTHAYRLGWGGEKNNYYYQYYPQDVAETEFSTKRGKKRELIEKYWKLMPQCLIKIIGPQIVKQFP